MLGRYGKGKLFLFFDLKKRVLKEWTLDQNEMWEYRDWQIFYIEIKKLNTTSEFKLESLADFFKLL